MMGWFRELKSVLADEPETWLAYLYGQQLDNLPLLTSKEPSFQGLFLQLAKYVALLIRDCKLKQHLQLKKPTKFLFFASSYNQLNSLDCTVRALRQKDETVTVVVTKNLLKSNIAQAGHLPYQLTMLDIWRSSVLFVTRGARLYCDLQDKHQVAVKWYFAHFCTAYTYLAYFYRVLTKTNPEFVITANDHNVQNRCLLAVAHHLGIKTVYLQHASVSPIFPALRVNYAFLDGQCALDTYRQCESNQPNTARNVPIPKVILSGQKKHLKSSGKLNKNVVGVALNALDDITKTIEFTRYLERRGQYVRLRWHPALPPKDVSKYREAFADCERISFSDPVREPVADFMGEVRWLIAGNSSIHLEAALAGVRPIYYEFSPPEQPDYYGYVKNGLADPAATVEDILQIIQETTHDYSPDIEAVRYYSATYRTEWEGREGELVALCLDFLSLRKKLPVNIIDFKPDATYKAGAP